MHGGVILFRGSGTDARRYLESYRSRADEYYLEGGVALAEFSVVDGAGAVIGEGALIPGRVCAVGRLDQPVHGRVDGQAPPSGRGSAGVAAVRGDGRERAQEPADRCRAAS